MKITTKLSLMVLVGSVLSLLLVAVGWNTASYQIKGLNTIVDDKFTPLLEERITPLLEDDILPMLNKEVPHIQVMNNSIRLMLDADRDIYQALVAERIYITESDPDIQAAARKEYLDNAQQVLDRIQQAGEGLGSEKAKTYYTKCLSEYSVWRHASDAIFTDFDEPDTRQAAIDSSFRGAASKAFKVFRTLLDEVKEVHQVDIDDRYDLLTKRKDRINEQLTATAEQQQVVFQTAAKIREKSHQAMMLFIVIGGVTICITATMGYFIARSIRKPIANILKVSDQVVRGQFEMSETTFGKSKDEVGQLSKAFSNIVHTLQKMDSEIQKVVKSARQGDLQQRGKASEFDGSYRELVEGINNVVDAFAAPVNNARGVMEKIAKGDLTTQMSGNYQGDFQKLQSSINEALDALNSSLESVFETGMNVADASRRVESSSQVVAQGATQQATALEEVSASLEEMSSMTRQTAENSQQAKKLSDTTSLAVKKGDELMSRLADAINKIKATSDDQARIIKSIDEIAFRTNMLALNAAVEASRAGEAGRGFAVVADEVRNLALQTVKATEETSRMITTAREFADLGVTINRQVADSFTEIGSHTERTNTLIAEITAATSEQAQGIEQTNLAITEIDKATQVASQNSQESLNVATSLNSNVHQLQGAISRFTLKDARMEYSSGGSRERMKSARKPAANKKLTQPDLGVSDSLHMEAELAHAH